MGRRLAMSATAPGDSCVRLLRRPVTGTSDSFTYTVTDETLKTSATAEVSVALNPTLASGGTITLSGSGNIVAGGNGNVNVSGSGNNNSNTVTLGSGTDSVTLNGNGNTVALGNGHDTVTLSGNNGCQRARICARG
jgi:lipopolysaccharide export system protein LptA